MQVHKSLFKAVWFLIFVIFISACATSDRVTHEFDLDDADLAWLENTDFIPIPEVPYRSDQDFFSPRIADSDSLGRESIARLAERDLAEIERESDPVAQGVALCYRKRFQEGFQVLDAAYDEYKSHPSYWNQIGTCYYLQNKINKALLYYNKSRGIDKEYAPAINNIGVIYLSQGHEQRAMKAFEQASELNTFAQTPSFNLAQLYLKYGFASKARRLLTGLFQSHAEDVDVLTGIATSYLLEGDYARAASFYNRVPRQYHNRPYIGLNFSVALKALGRDRDAETIFTQVDRNELYAYRDYYFEVEKFVRSQL